MHAVQDLNIDRAFVKQRRGTVAMIEAELAVVLPKVSNPEFLAGKIEGLYGAVAGHYPHGAPVRDWRGGRHVPLADLVIVVRDLLLPTHRAVCRVDAPEIEAPAVGNMQEDVLSPHNGR